MAYTEALAGRIRKALSHLPDVVEQAKMGGISFMVNGKMCVRAHADGGMMLRCDPDRTEELLKKKGVSRFEMKGKTQMKGWLVITLESLAAAKEFSFWMALALEYNGKVTKTR
jgi:hypothetical protein